MVIQQGSARLALGFFITRQASRKTKKHAENRQKKQNTHYVAMNC